jgi:indolepyruvate ferredoxin oxidoreductase, beta subunit
MNAPFPQRQRPITIAILAMGGEGGGVLADWIVGLAEHNRYIAQLTSVPGVAQRTGATIYYLEMYPRAAITNATHEPVLALMPVPGDVDIVIASELMEAGRAIQRGLITPDRTTLIASTNRVFSMTERIALADGRVDDAKLIEACRSAARTMHAFDMAALAEATGSVISAVLFGALAGAGVLPFPRQAFEGAIKRGGKGVQASLAAFTAGFEATTAGTATVRTPAVTLPPPTLDGQDSDETPTKASPHKPIPAELLQETDRFPANARTIVRAGVERTADYQSLAYVRLYLERLAPIASADKDGRLVSETARQLALGMTYEDTIRVAELKIRLSRFERVRAEVRVNDDQILEIAEFMHPRTQEIADTLPATLGRLILNTGWVRRLMDRTTRKGRVVKTTSLSGFLLLYLVASLKPLRPRSLRYSVEQRQLADWLATVRRLAATHYDLAIEVATARNLVKGYGDTHERGRARFETLMGVLPALAQRADGAAQLAMLRKAANADDTGSALNAAIVAVKEPNSKPHPEERCAATRLEG